MTGTFDFNLSCPCDGRLARIITDIVRQAARDAGRDDAGRLGDGGLGRRIRPRLLRRRREQPPIKVHVNSESIGSTRPAARCRWRSDPVLMLRLYNTLSRQEEPFAPSRDNTVRMYACGLTVYARGHIGNFRTFVCLDVLRRALKYLCGHQVRGVLNYTDVDDKTIAGAAKAGMPLRELHRAVDPGVPRRFGAARPRAAGGDAARHRRDEPAGDDRHGAGARAQRPHLPPRRLGLLPDRVAARPTASWRASIPRA